jgi:hypothetical protein
MPTILLTILLLASFSTVHAHPVIFKEGIVLSSSNMESYSDNQLLYSFSHRWAAGANHWRFTKDDKNSELGLGRLNHLLWRHNSENSQANIYLSTGLGVIDSELGKRDTREVYMGGFEIDWETRTLFTALKHYQFSTPALTDISMTQVRIGISPYEAPFENLQSWFMLQAMLMPEVDKSVILTPMVRFFYHNVLWEVGSSTRGEWMLNLMVHI